MAVKTTSIGVFLDKSVRGNKLFHQITNIDLNRMELLKYAILAWEVPEHVKESDYNYLQNKIPALDLYLEDFVEFTKDSIFNLGKDDRNKNLISEYLGVGVGLKYSTLLLNTTPNKFKKINRPIRGKYLDYSTICAKRAYEIETKGTLGSSYSIMKKDVFDKKRAQKQEDNVYLRYGTIFLAKKKAANSGTKSKCVVVDDPPPANEIEHDDTFTTQLYSYAGFLSQLLDSKYYNKYIEKLRKNRVNRLYVPEGKFYGVYEFEGRRYFGECFDYRLIIDQFKSDILANKKVREIFAGLTEKLGQTKFFIGLEESIVGAINAKNHVYLDTYVRDQRIILEQFVLKFLDKDGILLVKAINGHDKQIDRIFPEEEVERRLSLYISYIEGRAHKCGAPCTSPGLEGKPCEKLTFRKLCYFHR